MPVSITSENCFACGRKLGNNPRKADTRDGQIVYVGIECAKLIDAAGEAGYQPPKGGPRLYPIIASREERGLRETPPSWKKKNAEERTP